MIKYPEPGRVKTRLAKEIGNRRAAEIYRQLAVQILKQTDPVSFRRHPVQCPTLKKGGWGDLNENSLCREISPTPSLPTVGRTEPPKRGISENCSRGETTPVAYRRIVLYDPPERLHDFELWLPGNQFIPQHGDDVGERMDNAIRELLACGAEKAVLTGADIPDLSAEIIVKAFAALDQADIVIGPAADGGYYLIGMKKPHSEIFQGIPWSTERVFETTVCRIRKLQLSYISTITLSDIDRLEDLKHFRSH
ncbi:MAG: TIGR04282 family arsenosugar biosynthesis glycosyltransferase [Nitrospirota bacterium]|nr:TIGR04282 family arsenosugar biosynthesis glycosyltransferase [Nitrospirota bacterium]